MLYNLLTSSCTRNVISAYSEDTLAIYDLEEYPNNMFDCLLSCNKQETIPFEALSSTKVYDDAFVWHNNRRYRVHGTLIKLSSIPKWEFGSVFGIVSYWSNAENAVSFRVVDLSVLMRLYQTKDIIDAFSMWRLMQENYDFCRLYGILIVTSTTQLIQTNIYIELMNRTSRELSLHPAKVYYSSKQLLEHIYDRVIRSVDIRRSSEDIHAFVAFNTTRSELNNFATYINYPYVVNVNLDNVDSGKLDYSTVGCQGFGDLNIQNSRGSILLLHPNASLVGDCQNRAITLNWLISKTYSLD